MNPFESHFQTSPGQESDRRIQGEEFALPGRWAGYRIPTRFPIRREAERDRLEQALWTLLSRLHPADSQPGVFLLMDNLHRDNAVLRLSRNARDWRPTMGLGLWPDQPPPRTMTGADILDLEWGTTPRLPMHKVAGLGADSDMLHTAWTTMFGLGSSILTLGTGGAKRMLAETRQALKAPITDEGFQDFPFYFPLLGKKALSKATVEELDSWLGSTQLYLRESEEDKAILLLTRTHPLTLSKVLEELGFAVMISEEKTSGPERTNP